MVISGLETGGSLPTGAPNDLFFSAGRSLALINNGGDNVIVYDPTADEYIAARFNGDPLDDPTLGVGGYSGFSSTATQQGAGENFGNDSDGFSLQRTGDGSNTFSFATPTPGTTNVCFVNGTRLLTPTGPRKVENLRVGDFLETADHGKQRVSWVFAKPWTAKDLETDEKLRPVVIRAGALGASLPKHDLYLSQQHRVLVQGPIAQRMFGTNEILIAAKFLTPLDGVTISLDFKPLAYFHVMLEAHEILLAEGISAESLYLGRQAIRSIPDAALRDIERVLDTSIDRLIDAPPARARPFGSGEKARNLIRRHQKNNRPIAVTSI